jgi:hypothetical protein
VVAAQIGHRVDIAVSAPLAQVTAQATLGHVAIVGLPYTDRRASMSAPDPQVDFIAPAELRKWPLVNKERVSALWDATARDIAWRAECILRQKASRPLPQSFGFALERAARNSLL